MNPITLKKFRFWVPALIWMGIIFVFSSFPDPMPLVELSALKEWIGRTGHFLEYAGLAFWLYFGQVDGKLGEGEVSIKVMLISFLGAVAYALTDEAHQIFVPGRTFQWLDLVVDAAGAAVSMVCVKALERCGK
jgi:VanZ family protein